MRKWGALIILSSAMFIIVIDTTIMNVSISALVKDLNTTVGGVQSAISIYALVMASFMLPGGKLADSWGKKKVFYLGIFIFGVGTLTASFAQNLGMLIISWSVLEGLGSAFMMPNIQTILRSTYKDKERALSYGVIGAVGAVGAAVGPLVGGFLTTFYSWRWAFRFEVAIVLLIIVFHFLIRKDVLPKIKHRFDIAGATMSALGLFSIVLGILLAADYGLWFAKKPLEVGEFTIAPFGLSVVPFLIGFGLILLYLLFKWEGKLEKENKNGLFKPSLFSIRGLNPGFFTRFFQLMISAGILFTIPLYLQLTFNFTAMQTGVFLMPFSIALTIFAIFGSKLSSKYSAKRIIQVGLVFTMFGLLWMAQSLNNTPEPTNIIPGSIVLGLGLGLIASQIINLVLSMVTDKQTAETAGINSTFEQLGNSIGVALVGSVMVASIITSATKGVSESMVIPNESKKEMTANIESGVELISDSQLKQGLSEANATDEEKNEVYSIYSKSRDRAFQSSLMFLFFVAVVALLTSGGLANKKLVTA